MSDGATTHKYEVLDSTPPRNGKSAAAWVAVAVDNPDKWVKVDDRKASSVSASCAYYSNKNQHPGRFKCVVRGGTAYVRYTE